MVVGSHLGENYNQNNTSYQNAGQVCFGTNVIAMSGWLTPLALQSLHSITFGVMEGLHS